MKTISKRFRFGQYWEILMIDGQVFFLAKDILDYFDYAKSSQGTIHGAVQEQDVKMISGQAIKNLKHIKSRAMVINKTALIEFIYSRDADRKAKGVEFLKFVNEKAIPELSKMWKNIKPEGIPIEPEKPINLFDDIRDRDIDDLKSIVKIQSERIDDLEKIVQNIQKTQLAVSDVTNNDRENSIISGLIEKLTAMSQSNSVRG